MSNTGMFGNVTKHNGALLLFKMVH
jgi:hypothetical protein